MLKQTRLRAIAVLLLLFATDGMAKADTPLNNGPTRAQLEAIAAWVSKTLNLPNAEDLPRVALVPQIELARLRYGRLFAGPERTIAGEGRSQAIGGEHSTPLPQYLRQVVAVYDDATGTIYLPETWTGRSASEQSLLVHEMVHHLQNLAGLKYACGGAREKPAYLAQRKWLEVHDLDLEKEFDVDLFTIVARSICMD